MQSISSKIKKVLSEPSENQNLFYWFHKGLGIVYLTALFPLFFQIQALIGADGLMPAKSLIDTSYSEQGLLRSFMQFPSLFHFLPFDNTLYFLVFIGCVGALLLIIGYKIFLGALLAWISFLSITSIGGDFFVIIIDLFLSEVGFLALFSSYYLAKSIQVPKLIAFAFQLLNFRLWFCMGINKFYMPTEVWTDFTFFNYYFQAQPMPSPLAPLFNSAPKLLKDMAQIGMFIAEVIVPFFVFGGKRMRKLAFFTFLIISILIQLSGNFGYFNILSIVLALLILKDGDFQLFLVKNKFSDNSRHPLILLPIKIILVFQITLQLAYCLYVFDPKPHSYQNHFNFIFSTQHPESKMVRTIIEPFKYLEYWRICNPYGVFKGIPYQHAEIRLSGSYDGITWQNYEFKYLPSGSTDYLGFYAPYYPRLDHLFFYETIAAQNYKWNPLNKFYNEKNTWYCNFINKLLENDLYCTQLLKTNPFKGMAAPSYIKAQVFRLSFSHVTGKNWMSRPMNITKTYEISNSCYAPLMAYEEGLKVTYSKEE